MGSGRTVDRDPRPWGVDMSDGRGPFGFGSRPDSGSWGPPAPPGGFPPPATPPGGTAAGTPGGWSPVPGPPQADPGGAPFEQRGFGGELVGRPPVGWLVGALVLGVAAAAIALTLGASFWVAMGAWLVAGPVAIGLLAVFGQRDIRQRARPIYHAPSWVPLLYWSTLVAAAAGVGASAWRLAEWAGRL
jgi:hypothetical protein